MALTDFKKFKADFYGRVKDLSLFDCMEFNLLKVVLDGLKVDYVGRGKVSLHLLSGYGETYHWLKSTFFTLRNQGNSTNFPSQIDTLLLDNGRGMINPQGKVVSCYMENIANFLKAKQHNYILATEKNNKQVNGYQLIVPNFYQEAIHQPLSKEEKKLLAALRKNFKTIKKQGIFDEKELKNIQYAFIKFFYEYKQWTYFFNKVNCKQVIFLCHYHKEGFLLACKRNGIITKELQHGLIAPEDIFYMFPPAVSSVVDKALFADKIYTFGEFWTERLIKGTEYKPTQIINLGYYMYANPQFTEEQKVTIHNFVQNRKIILITTQTFMHEYFVQYIDFLSRDLVQKGQEDYCIIVKKHPAESKEHYKSLENMPNVKLIDANLDALLTISEMQISVYSTTLYDGVRHGVKGFALYWEAFGDYVNSVVASGVAQKLMPNESPLDKNGAAENAINIAYYYQQPNYSQLI